MSKSKPKPNAKPHIIIVSQNRFDPAPYVAVKELVEELLQIGVKVVCGHEDTLSLHLAEQLATREVMFYRTVAENIYDGQKGTILNIANLPGTLINLHVTEKEMTDAKTRKNEILANYLRNETFLGLLQFLQEQDVHLEPVVEQTLLTEVLSFKASNEAGKAGHQDEQNLLNGMLGTIHGKTLALVKEHPGAVIVLFGINIKYGRSLTRLLLQVADVRLVETYMHKTQIDQLKKVGFSPNTSKELESFIELQEKLTFGSNLPTEILTKQVFTYKHPSVALAVSDKAKNSADIQVLVLDGEVVEGKDAFKSILAEVAQLQVTLKNKEGKSIRFNVSHVDAMIIEHGLKKTTLSNLTQYDIKSLREAGIYVNENNPVRGSHTAKAKQSMEKTFTVIATADMWPTVECKQTELGRREIVVGKTVDQTLSECDSIIRKQALATVRKEIEEENAIVRQTGMKWGDNVLRPKLFEPKYDVASVTKVNTIPRSFS